MEGAYLAKKKDGSVYYRSSINFNSIHISLGSYETEKKAHQAYLDAKKLYTDKRITVTNLRRYVRTISREKAIVILNYRDHGMYIKNPIYLQRGFFLYFLPDHTILKFDADDLFYYSAHKILKRQGSLYVNDYGSQYRLVSRYGIKNYAVPGRDYIFVNGDQTDYRRANLLLLSHYHGVLRVPDTIPPKFEVKIHIRGDFRIGIFDSEEEAAVAYNKAAEFAIEKGIEKNFPLNYVDTLSEAEYYHIYEEIKLPKRYQQSLLIRE